jgi:uracil-DNA glycosylase
MDTLLNEIKSCTHCAQFLVHDPRPVLSANKRCRVAIVGQAPGAVVHKTGIPWDDKSGQNLREWLSIDAETFYDKSKVALVPMGFCYPGRGKSGDLPPRPECAPKWHDAVFAEMNSLELTLLVGKYAQDYYLEVGKQTLTETVRAFSNFLPSHFPLPHPSPRNNIWQAKNKWFASDVIPALRERVAEALS